MDNNWQIIQQQPVDFIELAFGVEMWHKEKEIAESVRDHRYTTVRSCHGSGKSFTSGHIVLWFLNSFPNSIVITTAPTFRQVEDILWREIRAAKQKARIPLGGNLTNTSLDISEKWFALGLSTNEPSRFQGYHADYILLIVDEAAGVGQEIFDASEGIVSSEHAKVLYIGNPTTIEGQFYSSFKSPSFNKLHISAFDTPNFTQFGITIDDIRNNTWKQKINAALPAPYLITPEWVADKHQRWGEGTPMWDSRVMGNFPEQGEDTLIPLNKIEAAIYRELTVKPEDPESIGVDIARFGSDKTIFLYRKGAKVLDIKDLTQLDTVQSSGHLRHFMGIHPFAAVRIDDIGVGAGVLDNVKSNEPYKDVKGVNVGLASHQPEMFYNLRAEIYWNLRERFINDDIDIPNDDELGSQLANIKFEYTPKGQIKIEPKEEMKKRGLPSPDKADALALAYGNIQGKPAILEFMKGLAA